MEKFIVYLRVSTQHQGADGNGIEGQRLAVAEYVKRVKGKIVLPEYLEVETGKSKARPQLLKAIAACRQHGAILLVAKLDRLARNAAFIGQLQESGVKFRACDMPDANELTVNIMAAMAQEYARQVSENTKRGLAGAKERGVKLGRPEWKQEDRQKGTDAAKANADDWARGILALIKPMRDNGQTLADIADVLNSTNVPTRRGGTWTATTVRRVLARAG